VRGERDARAPHRTFTPCARYGQSTSTEALKAGIYNDPVTPPQPRASLVLLRSFSAGPLTRPHAQ